MRTLVSKFRSATSWSRPWEAPPAGRPVRRGVGPAFAWVLALTALTLGWSAAFPAPAAAGEYTKLTPKKARGKRDLVIVLGGDVSYPVGKYDRFLEEQGPRLLASVRPYFRQGDIVFVNLEGPLTTGDVVGSKTYQFTIPPHRLDWILENGVDLLSLANNHVEDAGQSGLEDTLSTLKKAARGRFLHWAGARLDGGPPTEPVYFTPKGKDLRVAFIAATYRGGRRVATVGGSGLLDAVREADRKADVVIVSMHFGLEYVHVPKRPKQRLFRSLVDAGADVVVGHHPHVIQGVERRGDGIIFYSLGNLSFASKTVRHRAADAKMYGMLPLVEVKDGRLHRAEIVPLWVNNTESWTIEGETLQRARFVPVVLRGVFADAVVGAIREWSSAIEGNETKIHLRKGKAIVRFDGK